MMNVLAINSGSSSLKFKIVAFAESVGTVDNRHPNIRYDGSVQEIGPAAEQTLRFAGKIVARSTCAISTHTEAVQCMMQMLEESSRHEGQALCVDAVGHRVVHGGEQFREPVVIDRKSVV